MNPTITRSDRTSLSSALLQRNHSKALLAFVLGWSLAPFIANTAKGVTVSGDDSKSPPESIASSRPTAHLASPGTSGAGSGENTLFTEEQTYAHFASPAESQREAPRLDPILSDPSIPANWGLASIDSAGAWRLARGDRDVVVAVIDTGADVTHPALREHLWMNPGETGPDTLGRDKATNGIDDDGNGYIDDLYGWDFTTDSPAVTDRHGHGTHIAGIVGNVAPAARLMILKYYDPRKPGANTLANTVKAIRYAVRMGAKIINYSGGGRDPSPLEEEAIKLAEGKGVLFVAAAGNEASNSDIEPFFPADYDVSNILSVTAIDPQHSVLDSSNYGERTVDIAAPGIGILSTLPGGKFGVMTGTSQATAFASGVAALLRGHHPDLNSPQAIIRHLMNTGTMEPGLRGKTRARTVLNSYRALAMKDRGVAASGAIVRDAPTIDTSSSDSKLFLSEPESGPLSRSAAEVRGR